MRIAIRCIQEARQRATPKGQPRSRDDVIPLLSAQIAFYQRHQKLLCQLILSQCPNSCYVWLLASADHSLTRVDASVRRAPSP